MKHNKHNLLRKRPAWNMMLALCGLMVLWNAIAAPLFAADLTWAGGTIATGDWFNAANWDPAQAPTNDGDTVTITNGFILLTNSTAELASFTISNAALIFTNWTTALRAATVTVQNAGTLTLPLAFTNDQMSNRIWVVCSNLLLEAGGTMLADARGYARINGQGRGTISGANSGGGGGGYGGKGGSGGVAGGQSYGSTNAPLDPGSGGGNESTFISSGGHGGGAVLIEASVGVTIDGTVSANGGNGAVGGNGAGGGGSGGSIFITCPAFGGGAGGILRANGGAPGIGGLSGPAGGGRIAVIYQSLAGTPGVQISANCGSGKYAADVNAPLEDFAPQVGTLYFPTPELLDAIPAAWGGVGAGLNGYFVFQSTNNWAPTSLLVLSNSTIGIFEGSGFLTATDLTITATGGLVVAPHATLECGGSLALTNGSSLVVYGGATNAVYTNAYGTVAGVTNTLTVSSNCWIYPFAHSTNGGIALLRLGSLKVLGGGGINADGRGFARTKGPGRGSDAGSNGGGGGGGHGGKGGSGSAGAGGAPYGLTNAPVTPGSGGGNEATYTDRAGHGGGVIRIEASSAVTIDGTLSANGGSGATSGNGAGGGGSGGSIFISCSAFGGGVSGILRANGGAPGVGGLSGPAGAGGGGRIAVAYQSLVGTPGIMASANCNIGKYTVDVNAPAEPFAPQIGTLFFSDTELPDSILTARSGTAAGLNGYFAFQSTNAWAPTNLLVLSDSTLGVLEGNIFQPAGDLTITATGGVVIAPHGILNCGGKLTLTNSSRMIIYGGVTNAIYTNGYGTMAGITNTLTISTNCWIYPFSHSTNGGSVFLKVGALAILSGGGIDANGRGYARTNGYGRGANVGSNGGGGGGGYGGKGGTSSGAGGQPYGVTNAPRDPGSGGGNEVTYNDRAGHGGGVVWVDSSGTITIDGTVSANGGSGTQSGNGAGGGGSGGSIYMICSRFAGNSNGIIRANGGTGGYAYGIPRGGGGGGGRVAIWIGINEGRRNQYLAGNPGIIIMSDSYKDYGGVFAATNGTGYTNLPPNGAEVGTARFFSFPAGGTVFVMK